MGIADLPHIEAACRQALVSLELENYLEPCLQAVEPTILCEKKGERVMAEPRLGGTKVGGFPHLLPSLAWPEFGGKRLPFIAQVNLSELCKLLQHPLPAHGILYFFHWATNEMEENPTAVLWAETATDVEAQDVDGERVHRDWQGVAIYDEEFAHTSKLGVSFSPVVAETCARKLGLLGEDEQVHDIWGDFADDFASDVDILLKYGLDVWEREEYAEEGIAIEFTTLLETFGYPDPNDYFLVELRPTEGGHSDGVDRWQNVLHVWSTHNMLWSDCGTLGFFIRDDDLARCDFSRAVASVMSS